MALVLSGWLVKPGIFAALSMIVHRILMLMLRLLIFVSFYVICARIKRHFQQTDPERHPCWSNIGRIGAVNALI